MKGFYHAALTAGKSCRVQIFVIVIRQEEYKLYSLVFTCITLHAMCTQIIHICMHVKFVEKNMAVKQVLRLITLNYFLCTSSKEKQIDNLSEAPNCYGDIWRYFISRIFIELAKMQKKHLQVYMFS